GWVLPVIAVGLWAFVSVMAGAAYPAFIQNFRVNPTESAKERPYIDRNIKATRAALKLGGTTVKNYNYNENLTAADRGNNPVTAPANAGTPAGAPDLLVKHLPPQGSMPLTQPAVYYGPDLGGYSIVNTDQKEVDFTEASGVNHLSTYKGKGGVQMSSWIRRAAL